MRKCCLLFSIVLLQALGQQASSQLTIKGKIVDANTKEALPGASIRCGDEQCNAASKSNAEGDFELSCRQCCKKLVITAAGYVAADVSLSEGYHVVMLYPDVTQLQEVVVTAAKGEAIKRSEAPIAISVLSNKVIQDAKATSFDQVLNKVSGVNMVNLGNEQHEMSIRQPMTTRSVFLYLEDGVPIRTSGLYNHNAILEINMASVKSIEVIKGPSSSLYGSEAIGGVVNFITAAPAAIPVLKLSAQLNNIGYKRADLVASASKGKWGFMLSGYYADKYNGYLQYSDFHKATLTAKIDYHFSPRTVLTNSITWLNYYSDMSGSIDSAMFASHTFSNLQTFTYRKVDALRYRSTLTHTWNENSKTTATLLLRDNTIGQNPAYRIKDDYHRQGSVFVGNKELAHGEINDNSFTSFSFIGQHKQSFGWKKSVLIGGLSVDLSPSTYKAGYIRIKKDTITRKYVSYETTDSVLTDYATGLNNYAAFLSYEFSPVEKLRIVSSIRYDLFHYTFTNHLTPSAFSGSPNTINNFSRFSPKLGFTYHFSSKTGMYANYSEGFVPPQITELYTGIKVPELKPAVFYNYEIGGWFTLVPGKVVADLSIYHLKGSNEIISVKLDDGSFANENAGRTLHKGIEAGLNVTAPRDLSIRFSGAYSRHIFIDYTEKGVPYNGNEMNNAPAWLYNVEAWYRPSFAKGLRIGAEWQHVGEYFADPQNSATYKGYDVLNLRAGYQFYGWEVWVNILNATDSYYSYITSKSSFGYSYQLAEPVNFNAGISYDFGNLFKSKK